MSRRVLLAICHAAALAASIVYGGVGLAQAQRPAGLTLAEALERALTSNPTIVAARLQRPVSVAGIALAGLLPNPEIAYEWARETPRQSIGATLPIELGGKRQRRIDLAKATVAVSDADVARITAEVRNDVRRAYFGVVAADTRVDIAGDVRDLAQRARDAANARVGSGEAPRSDLTQSDLALAVATSDLSAARGEAAAMRAELNALLGQPPGAPLALADALGAATLMSLEEAVALAKTTNGDLQVLDRRLNEQAARINLTKALKTPDVAAGGAFTYDAEPEFRYGWRLTFAVTVPVLSSQKPAIAIEQATLAQLKAEREAVETRIIGAISAALGRAAAARDQLATYQNTILPLALEAERQAQAAYTGGQTGLAALVQALQAAREIRQRGLQSGLDYQHALADLERAIGAPIR